jgi:aminopeptidase N
MAATCMLTVLSCKAQPLSKKKEFTRQDTLRGTITPERAWWDVVHYDISVEPNYIEKTISGKNILAFKTVSGGNRMQLDLQVPMNIDSITLDGKALSFVREGNAWLVDLPSKIDKGVTKSLHISFSGKPTEAINPPWDGGWIWKKDKKGNPWMSVACQGLGASVWYPCKDHQSDEPDSASLTMTVPDSLIAIGNGRLRSKSAAGYGRTMYTWAVTNPINSYNIIPYIGKYVNWNENYAGEKGNLDVAYWVIDYNLEKAKEQFTQVPKMLKCFEHWFGPYPFYSDGFKLIESPHLGMEHQSAIAYGNGFQNGYLGKDLSGTGWGTKWDFIIIHESGHEWFANNITTNDIADMWVHEGFTNYSETIFTTCEYGVQAGNEYCIGTRKLIKNDAPIVGKYGVNHEGSGDMYYKGGNLVHLVRQIINDDEKFRTMLREMNQTYFHKTVDSKDIEAFMSKAAGRDLSKVFDQYLRTTEIPVLEYEIKNKNNVRVRWTNCLDGFDLSVRILPSNQWIQPTNEWQMIRVEQPIKGKELKVDPNFYIQTKKAG